MYKYDLRKKESWIKIKEDIVSKELEDFKLTYTKHVYLLYSGGIGSCLAAFLLKKSGVMFTLYFNDTKTEDEDLYRFLQETKEIFDVPFIADSDGRDVFEVFVDNKFFGNSRVDLCSRILKRDRSTAFRKTLNHEDCIFANGIDLWEEHRLQKARPNWEPFTLVSPLIDAKVFDKDKLWDIFYLDTGIEKPYLYSIGFKHNNCGGFCVKAGLAHYRNMLEQDRTRYLYFEERESETYEKIGKKHPFLNRQEKGVKIFMTLREYREHLEKPEVVLSEEDKFQFGGCMACAL